MRSALVANTIQSGGGGVAYKTLSGLRLGDLRGHLFQSLDLSFQTLYKTHLFFSSQALGKPESIS